MVVSPQHLVVPVAFALGILVGKFFAGWFFPVLLIVAAMCVYMAVLIATRTPSLSLRRSGWHWTWIVLLFCGLGMLNMDFNRPELLPSSPSARSVASGVVQSVSHLTSGDRVVVDVDVISNSVEETWRFHNLTVIISGVATPVHVGDRIDFPAAKVQRISDNLNVRDSGYADFMASKGIFYRMYLRDDDVTVVEEGDGIRSFAAHMRDRLEILIEKSDLDHRTSSFLISLLLADRDFLPLERREAYADAGVSHMMAVSGMHVGIIGSFFFVLLFPLAVIGSYKLRYLCVIPLVWAYVILTGLTPSAVRAASMLTFCFVAIVLERQHSAIGALLWAAFFIILFSPLTLFDVGFQLSFVCVAALISFVRPLNTLSQRKHPNLYKVVSVILVTITATAASWTLSAYYFGKFPLFFLPANLIVIPLLPVYVGVAAMAIVCASVFGAIPAPLRFLVDEGYFAFESFVSILSHNNAGMPIDVGAVSVVLWLAGLLILAFALNFFKRPVVYLLGCFCLISAVVTAILCHSRAEGDGLIVRSSFPVIEVASYHGDDEEIISFPRGNISVIERSGKNIMVIDTPLPAVGIDLSDVDILVVGGGFSGSLKELLSTGNRLRHEIPIVIHPTFSIARENSHLEESRRLHRYLYSIRRQGPYRLFPM